MLRRIALVLAVLGLAGSAASLASGAGTPAFPSSGTHWAYSWHDTPTGSTASLRGVSAVSASTAWSSGSGGTVLRTVDRGATWQQVGPPGTELLQFRDIEAFDADHAVILSIGNGSDSRIYVTSDAGQSWTLAFVNDDPNAFYDCMTFFDDRRGLALSDPPDGNKFRILSTSNGGQTWHVVSPAGMPPALAGEFAFAASGQCIASDHGRRAWFGTGGSAQARVFRSDDRGQTWSVSATGILSSPSAGINRARLQRSAAWPGGGRRLCGTRQPRRTTSRPPGTAAARGSSCRALRRNTDRAPPGSTATR